VMQSIQDQGGVLLVVLGVMLEPGGCYGGCEQAGVVEWFASRVVRTE
jgi:hypothetical protein